MRYRVYRFNDERDDRLEFAGTIEASGHAEALERALPLLGEVVPAPFDERGDD